MRTIDSTGRCQYGLCELCGLMTLYGHW